MEGASLPESRQDMRFVNLEKMKKEECLRIYRVFCRELLNQISLHELLFLHIRKEKALGIFLAMPC